MNAFGPVAAQIKKQQHFEGDTGSISRADGTAGTIDYQQASAEMKIGHADLLYSDLRTILMKFDGAAESMASQRETALFRTIDEVTQNTGNRIDAQNKPFSAELFLETLEKIEIDFNEDGSPRFPTIVVAPSQRARVEELLREARNPFLSKKFDAVIAKKKEEWRAREARRFLAG
jgi:hypothetical protein